MARAAPHPVLGSVLHGGQATGGADLYVDDSPGNIAAFRDAGLPVLIFGHRYNRHIDGPRIHDWTEAADAVLRLATARD